MDREKAKTRNYYIGMVAGLLVGALLTFIIMTYATNIMNTDATTATGATGTSISEMKKKDASKDPTFEGHTNGVVDSGYHSFNMPAYKVNIVKENNIVPQDPIVRVTCDDGTKFELRYSDCKTTEGDYEEVKNDHITLEYDGYVDEDDLDKEILDTMNKNYLTYEIYLAKDTVSFIEEAIEFGEVEVKRVYEK